MLHPRHRVGLIMRPLLQRIPSSPMTGVWTRLHPSPAHWLSATARIWD